MTGFQKQLTLFPFSPSTRLLCHVSKIPHPFHFVFESAVGSRAELDKSDQGRLAGRSRRRSYLMLWICPPRRFVAFGLDQK
jgi:hypothetical protein